jgi:hypothetical protein
VGATALYQRVCQRINVFMAASRDHPRNNSRGNQVAISPFVNQGRHGEYGGDEHADLDRMFGSLGCE